MSVIRGREFRSDRSRGALDNATMQDASARRHRTDQRDKWHGNDADEVFAVPDGTVDMHERDAAQAHIAASVRTTWSTPMWEANMLLIRGAKRGFPLSRAKAASGATPPRKARQPSPAVIRIALSAAAVIHVSRRGSAPARTRPTSRAACPGRVEATGALLTSRPCRCPMACG